jgi:hypothetical protein
MEMGSNGLITLCIPRPDQLNGTVPLGSGIKVIDLNASDPSCTYALVRTQLPTGTVKGEGVCDNGTNAAGFALVFDGFALFSGWGPRISPRHGGSTNPQFTNVLCADGHAETVNFREIPDGCDVNDPDGLTAAYPTFNWMLNQK